MESAQVLLGIQLALQELQLTQKQILYRMDEDKEERKDIANRLTTIETRYTWMMGAAAPVTIIILLIVEWAKNKIGWQV